MNWADVERQLEFEQQQETGVSKLKIPKGQIVTPADAGAKKSLGIPVGQIAHWRFPPRPDGAGMHVHEYSDRYEAHLDRVHPEHSTVKHLVRDTPKLFWSAVAGVLSAVTWKIFK